VLTFSSFLKLLKESFRDLLPIILVILFFQLAIIQSVPEGWQNTSIGLVIVGIGLAIFLLGLEVGIFPVGEGLARDFAIKGSTIWIVLFTFMIGFGTTVAEPALLVISDQASFVSGGRITSFTLRIVVALSVGFGIVLGVWRIIKGHPIHYYIITGYILVVAATAFAPSEIVGLAYDLGGVTTSTITVPLVAALGIGLASTIEGRNPVLDGFGLIAFASLTPMIFVQFYGIYVYEFAEVVEMVAPIKQQIGTSTPTGFEFNLAGVLKGIVNIFFDVLPILAVIFFFQYIVLKKKVQNLKEVLIGFGLVIIGLYAFVLGLEMGLFTLGESMAFQLTQENNNILIYMFALAIGFSTTMAEPSLIAIAKKAKDISDERVNDFVLRIFVAVGVAIGIALGAYRIVNGGEIVYYIISGYLFVIFLTFMAPKYIIPISYDSGGVTTSTVTVPLVAALGLGLATNIVGRDPLIDGFGLIAFASLFPIITVMIYGIVVDKIGVKGKQELLDIKLGELRYALADANNMKLATVNVHKTDLRHSFRANFSAIHVIIPKEKEEKALLKAKEAGATGVTITEAHGMGLKEISNFYSRLKSANSDVSLMFIVSSKNVNRFVQKMMLDLDIVGEGSGIIYSHPISHLKGITLSIDDL